MIFVIVGGRDRTASTAHRRIPVELRGPVAASDRLTRGTAEPSIRRFDSDRRLVLLQ